MIFVISFDLVVAEADKHHPKGSRQAYTDISKTLAKFGFGRVQKSVFAAKDENLANLIGAVNALRAHDWLHKSVSNIRAFRMEEGSDLTDLFKSVGS